MGHFVVKRDAGPGWVANRGALEQPGAAEHSAFMNELAEQGVVLLAGPLDGSEHDRIHALLIMRAAGEAEVDQVLADDPWAASGQLRTVSVTPWNVFVGAERLAGRGRSPLAYSSAERDSNS
jgi:uncharacterized protein YciI